MKRGESSIHMRDIQISRALARRKFVITHESTDPHSDGRSASELKAAQKAHAAWVGARLRTERLGSRTHGEAGGLPPPASHDLVLIRSPDTHASARAVFEDGPS